MQTFLDRHLLIIGLQLRSLLPAVTIRKNTSQINFL